MTEIVFRKRRAKAGEIGLFVESPIWEEEWQSLRMDAEVTAQCTTDGQEKCRKFFHVLAGKLALNVDWFNNDKDFAKEQLLMECRHVTYHHDKLRGKTEIKAKTTKNLTHDQWIRLLRRCSYVVTTKFMPGMAENDLKAEIEKMVGDRYD
jgi:hypothetical protein